MENKMFCYQCQETAGCKGCTIAGVCGKKPEVAHMQDLLVYVTKGLSFVTTRLREEGKTVDKEVNHLVTVNLFTTITNANFDREAIIRDPSKRSFSPGLKTKKISRMQPPGPEVKRVLTQRPSRSAFSPQRTRTSALSVS